MNNWRTFIRPNTSHGWRCPLCGTADPDPVILIMVSGSAAAEGEIAEAEQFHEGCVREAINPVEMVFSRKDHALYWAHKLPEKFADVCKEDPTHDGECPACGGPLNRLNEGDVTTRVCLKPGCGWEREI